MKTTELYVEQVLIGAIALFALALPWTPEILSLVGDSKTADTFVGVTVAIGVSFLLGILFDRFADTLTEPLDKHNRIRFTWELVLKKFDWEYQAKAKDGTQKGNSLETVYGKVDPFREDFLRWKSLTQGDRIVDWFDYHRSRIRLARAMAVYFPVLTTAALIGMIRLPQCYVQNESWAFASLLIFLPYCVAAWWNKRREGILAQDAGEHNHFWFAPRTDELADAVTYAKRHFVHRAAPDAKKMKLDPLRGILLRDPMVLAGSLVLLLAAGLGIFVVISDHRQTALILAIFGVITTVMAAWSWLRISRTYRIYLAQLSSSTDTSNHAS